MGVFRNIRETGVTTLSDTQNSNWKWGGLASDKSSLFCENVAMKTNCCYENVMSHATPETNPHYTHENLSSHNIFELSLQ